jgi:hypothetical protein
LIGNILAIKRYMCTPMNQTGRKQVIGRQMLQADSRQAINKQCRLHMAISIGKEKQTTGRTFLSEDERK